MLRVAIFPCGSEVGLELHNALKFERQIELHGLSSVNCHGATIFRNYSCDIPWIRDPEFFDRLNRYIDAHSIDILFPAYDDVIAFLAENRERLHCKLAAPVASTCAIARSKAATYSALDGCSFNPGFTADPTDIREWPVFAKPDKGQGSQGVMLLNGPEDLTALSAAQDYVFAEYLPGAEYTVDCFSDRHGKLRLCMPRERLRTKSGISVRTRAVECSAEILGIGEQIQTRIPFRGAWFFQIKHAADGRLKLLEIAPRIGGSMGLTRNLGANLAMLTIWDLMDRDVEVLPQVDDRILDRYLGNRYLNVPAFSRVYIDYDDTVTCHGQINSAVMAFLYNCRNRNIPIVLLTRHAGDIQAELGRRGIAQALFESVIHITDGRPKSAAIPHPETAIFIDDSFAERRDVRANLGMAVFAPDAVESLVDWRFI